MTDPIEIARTASTILGIIGLLLCLIAWSLRDISRSLKKIADRENAIGFELTEDQQSNLFHQVGNIAWEAGRNFQAGTRTDR